MFHCANNTEYGKVGKNIYKHIIYHCAHTLRRASYYCQHYVSCLRNAAERHKTFEVALLYGKQVGDGDACNGGNVENNLPLFNQRGKYGGEHNEKGEYRSTFGDYRQIGCNGSGGTLVAVGSPHMEGYQRYFKAHSCEEHHKSIYLHR